MNSQTICPTIADVEADFAARHGSLDVSCASAVINGRLYVHYRDITARLKHITENCTHFPPDCVADARECLDRFGGYPVRDLGEATPENFQFAPFSAPSIGEIFPIIAPESPSVSNNHPTPDAEPGYAGVAGLNTGDAAAFNGGNSSGVFKEVKVKRLDGTYTNWSLRVADISIAAVIKFSDGEPPFIWPGEVKDGQLVSHRLMPNVLFPWSLDLLNEYWDDPVAHIRREEELIADFAGRIVSEPSPSEDEKPFIWADQADPGTCDLGPTPSPLSAFTFVIDPNNLSNEPSAHLQRMLERAALDKAIDSFGSVRIIDEASSDNPRIFFADEPRPAIWQILPRDQQHAIEAFAFGDLEAGDRLADEDIAVEILPDSAAGWHDTNPIVRVVIDGNEWNLEFEERSASEGNGNEDDFVGEANGNEDRSRDAAFLRAQRNDFRDRLVWLQQAFEALIAEQELFDNTSAS
jgi:hypothetical protein